MGMLEDTDWFTDLEVHQDPYPYYEELRSYGPAVRLPNYNVVAVTSYEELLKIDTKGEEKYSSVVSGTGPFPPLPFTPEGEDISDQIDAHRGQLNNGALLTSLDRPEHQKHRSLLMGVITPRRLKENEEFISRLTERQINTFIDRGSFEVVKELSHPLATLVTADLLGLPESEHARLLELLPAHTSSLGGTKKVTYNPLEAIDELLCAYIDDRRKSPQGDVFTKLALAKFPDGSTPQAHEVARLGSFLFAAGQDTTVRIIATSIRLLGDDLELQHALRKDREKIPAFIEEALRFESPSKVKFRLARVRDTIGDVELAPGTVVMCMVGAGNRDPNKFENPNSFILDRPNVRDHLGFGRGPHACPGAPLARTETLIALGQLFDRTSEFRINEAVHGPREARRYEFMPRYTARGPLNLHVEFTRA